VQACRRKSTPNSRLLYAGDIFDPRADQTLSISKSKLDSADLLNNLVNKMLINLTMPKRPRVKVLQTPIDKI